MGFYIVRVGGTHLEFDQLNMNNLLQLRKREYDDSTLASMFSPTEFLFKDKSILNVLLPLFFSFFSLSISIKRYFFKNKE